MKIFKMQANHSMIVEVVELDYNGYRYRVTGYPSILEARSHDAMVGRSHRGGWAKLNQGGTRTHVINEAKLFAERELEMEETSGHHPGPMLTIGELVDYMPSQKGTLITIKSIGPRCWEPPPVAGWSLERHSVHMSAPDEFTHNVQLICAGENDEG